MFGEMGSKGLKRLRHLTNKAMGMRDTHFFAGSWVFFEVGICNQDCPSYV